MGHHKSQFRNNNLSDYYSFITFRQKYSLGTFPNSDKRYPPTPAPHFPPPYTDTVIEISKVQYLKTAPLHSTLTDPCPPQKKKKKKKSSIKKPSGI